MYQWDKRFGGSGNEELRVVTQTPDGGLLLGGNSGSGVNGDRTQPNQGGMDYWLVKVPSETKPAVVARQAMGAVEPKIKRGSVNVTAFPNPFRDKLTIRFILPQTQAVSVKVYDSQGQEIAVLFQQEVKANQTYQLEWRADKKPTGMYILQLQTPTQRMQQKMLLIR